MAGFDQTDPGAGRGPVGAAEGDLPQLLACAPDNPLKGSVPYPGDHSTFPHIMQWDYTRLTEGMTGPT